MSFFSSIWPKRAKDLAGAASQNPSVIHSTTDSHSPVQSGGSPSPNGIRKDIIRVILKQTLTHNGIPTAWLAAQALVTKSREHSTGLHIRFSILHWDVRLMQHAFDFQEDFNDRLLALDPEAEAWMFGYSWQFKVPGISPGGMPHPGSWTSDTKVDKSARNKGDSRARRRERRRHIGAGGHFTPARLQCGRREERPESPQGVAPCRC